jgi:hypothetical protein
VELDHAVIIQDKGSGFISFFGGGSPPKKEIKTLGTEEQWL